MVLITVLNGSVATNIVIPCLERIGVFVKVKVFER